MKTALVTGANQGIGLEVVRQLLQLEYFVYLGCRNPESGASAIESLRKQGYQNTALVVLDVTDNASVIKAASEVLQNSPILDALVNNAGIRGNRPSDGGPIPIEEIQRVFETNYFGAIRVARAFLPLLRNSAAPRIVNVSSGIGSLTLQSDPNWKYYKFKSAAYFPSKAALNAFTVVLAYELGEPFKVNAIDPGYTSTAFNGYTGEKKPEDAARIVVENVTLDSKGPTGCFISEEGYLPW